MATYDKGDSVRVTATFTSDDVATDPTDNQDDITVTWRQPDGTDTSYTGTATITRTGAGVYYRDFTLNQIGTHVIRFTGSEGVIAVETIKLEVAKSIFDHS